MWKDLWNNYKNNVQVQISHILMQDDDDDDDDKSVLYNTCTYFGPA